MRENIGRAIKIKRIIAGLTQQEVVEAAGLARPTYVRYEAGQRIIPSDALVKVAAVLNVDPSELLIGESADPGAQSRRESVDGDSPALARAFAATLRAERGVAGLSQLQMEKATGISRTSYRLYELGERTPDVLQLAKITNAFGLTLTRFIEEVERRASLIDHDEVK